MSDIKLLNMGLFIGQTTAWGIGSYTTAPILWQKPAHFLVKGAESWQKSPPSKKILGLYQITQKGVIHVRHAQEQVKQG